MAGKKRKKRAGSRTRKISMRVRHASGDLVSIQVSARLKRIPKGLRITKKLLAAMVREKAETSAGYWNGSRTVGAREGDDPPGIELKIIRWRNPQRKTASGRAWRKGPQDEAWGSLRYALAGAAVSFR